MQKLQALKIGTGWHVQCNNLEHFDPAQMLDEEIEQSFVFKEDLCLFEKQNNETDDVWSIDVGFYPEANAKGCYRIVLLKNHDWDKLIFRYETKSLCDLTEKVNDLFINYAQLIV